MRPVKSILKLESLSAVILRATLNGVETTDERTTAGSRLRYDVQCKRCGTVHRLTKTEALKTFACKGCFQNMQVNTEAVTTVDKNPYVLRISSQLWGGYMDRIMAVLPYEACHTALTHGYELHVLIENQGVRSSEDIEPLLKAAMLRQTSKNPVRVAQLLDSLPKQGISGAPVAIDDEATRAVLAELPEAPIPAEELEDVIRPLKPLQPLIPHTPQETKSLTLPPLPTEELDDIDNAANFSEKLDLSFFNTKDD